MEGARPDLGRTLASVLDLDDPEGGRLPLPVKGALKDALRSPVHRDAARAKAEAVVVEIRPELEGTAWFNDRWVDEVLGRIERSFDAACGRWRSLYRAAARRREIHHAVIGDHSRPEAERNHSRRLRAQAESQIRLLTEAEGVYEGDFYSYERRAVRHPRPPYPARLLLPGGERRDLHRRPAARRPGPDPRGSGKDPRPDRGGVHRAPLPSRGGLACRIPPPCRCVRHPERMSRSEATPDPGLHATGSLPAGIRPSAQARASLDNAAPEVNRRAVPSRYNPVRFIEFRGF